MKLAHDTVYSQDVNITNADKLDLALCYLQLPSSIARSVKAYNLVMDVRNFSKTCTLQCAVSCKNAAMAIRDVLDLQICCGVESMSYVSCDKVNPIEDSARITTDDESDSSDQQDHGPELLPPSLADVPFQPCVAGRKPLHIDQVSEAIANKYPRHGMKRPAAAVAKERPHTAKQCPAAASPIVARPKRVGNKPFFDPTLPRGWSCFTTPPRSDKYYVAPCGKILKSKVQAHEYLACRQLCAELARSGGNRSRDAKRSRIGTHPHNGTIL